MRLDVAFWGLLAAAAALVLAFRPAEQALPFAGARPTPELRELRGLRHSSDDGPGWRAELARPEGAGTLTVAGAWSALALEGVTVAIDDDIELTAAAGTWRDGALELGPNVRVRIGARDRLVAAAAHIDADRARFPGLVQIHPRDGEPELRRGLDLSLAELAELLR